MTEATVFVPGHVTGFFTVDRDDDPTKAGSRGAGLTLEDGVEVTVSDAETRTVTLDEEPIDIGAVETVLDTLEADVEVTASSDVPLGAGFGVSGAMALGAALGTNRALDRGLSWNELVTIAHGAEVQAGSGLGDVVAQAAGGMPLRLEPGGPHDNYLDAIPARPEIEYVSFGELDTSTVIGGDTENLTQAGEQAISHVVKEPTPEGMVYASRRFAREAQLLTEQVQRTITDVTGIGGEASMAMLGETVFALEDGLSEAGYAAKETRVDAAGARFL
jgi:pantoate kinase